MIFSKKRKINFEDYFLDKYGKTIKNYFKLYQNKSDDPKTKGIYELKKQVYDKFDVVDMKILSRRILKEEIPILENFKDKLNLISKNFYSDNKKFRNVKNAKLVSDFLLSAKFALKSWNEKYLELITILKAEAMDLYNKNKKESENYNWGEFKKLFMSEVNLLKETSTLVTPLKKRLGILKIIEEYGQRKIGQIIDEFKHPILVMSIFLLLFAVRNSYGQEWKLIEVGDNLTEESKTDSTNNEAFLPICQLLKDNDLFKEIINRKIHLQYWKVDTVKENNGAAAIFIPSFLGTGGIIKYTDPRYLEKEDSIYFKYILYHEYVHVMQEENIKNYFGNNPNKMPDWKIKFYYAKLDSSYHLGGELEAYYKQALLEQKEIGTISKGTSCGFIIFYLRIIRSENYKNYLEVQNYVNNIYEDFVKQTNLSKDKIIDDNKKMKGQMN